MTKNYKLTAWLAALALVGAVALWVLEMRALDNTVDGGNLLKWGALTGLLIGLAVSIYFQQKTKVKEAVPILRAWLVCLSVPVFLCPLFGSLANRIFASDEKNVRVEFLEEKPILGGLLDFAEGEKIRPDGYHLFVFYEGKIKRFARTEECCPHLERGDSVAVKIREGALGFDFME